MDYATLAKCRSNARWLIYKRTGFKLIKSVSFGSEKLDELVDKIAAIYYLDDEDKALLHPTKTVDTLAGADTAAAFVKDADRLKTAAEGVKIMSEARKAGKLMATAKGFATGGMDAAKTAAGMAKATKAASRVGRAAKTAGQVGKAAGTASKAVGIAGKAAGAAGSRIGPVAIATTIYVVGTTGIFTHRAWQYERACYDMWRARLDALAEVEADGEQGAETGNVAMA